MEILAFLLFVVATICAGITAVQTRSLLAAAVMFLSAGAAVLYLPGA
jgi:hypothetical protein